MSELVLWGLRCLGRLPLPWLRWLGVGLGQLLFVLVASRRKVVLRNLSLCFPALGPARVRALARQVFVCVAQSWLDRGWLWHGSSALLRQRLVVTGAVDELSMADPVVLFAPHFVGMDAGWTALTQQLPRRFTTIYTDQANKTMDAWILAGRQRFGTGQLFGRADGVKAIVAALRQGDPLYLLPDMNFGPKESIFVPFYGISAATVPSLARFARLGRAKVVPVVTRLTATGYEVRLLPRWEHFPTQDLEADTAEMNRRLQTLIDAMPEQYYWVHKRFKDQPPGEPKIYQ
jgi:KDO2-lipid IV(A) lauroyltransferase